MVNKDFLIKKPEELQTISSWLEEMLEHKTIVLLEGPLGVGKTALVKKIAAEQGFSENKVKSPTFSLINNYKTEKFNLSHIDLYRLDTHDQFLLEEIKELLELPNSIILIEWPEKMDLSILYLQAIQVINIKLSFQSKSFRKVSICVKNTANRKTV